MSNLNTIIKKLEECMFLADQECVKTSPILEMLDIQEAKARIQLAHVRLMSIERHRRRAELDRNTQTVGIVLKALAP